MHGRRPGRECPRSYLRLADEMFTNSIKEVGLYDEIGQAFAVYLCAKTVGVQAGKRTHSHAIALRAITSAKTVGVQGDKRTHSHAIALRTSQDGMTADWYQFDSKFLGAVSSKICESVRGVNRIVYDITSKPPATVEWE